MSKIPSGTDILKYFSLSIMETVERNGKVNGFGLPCQVSLGKSAYISESVSPSIKWDLGVSSDWAVKTIN